MAGPTPPTAHRTLLPAGVWLAGALAAWAGTRALGVECAPVVIVVAGGAATAWLLARDARAQARHDAELGAARHGIAEAARAKSDFLANMSHELRTPMTAILGYAELLLDGQRTEINRLDCVQTIRRNSHHLLQLVDDLLDLTKIEAGKMEVSPVDVEPGAVLAEVLSLLQVRAAEKHLHLSAVYATEVPMRVRTDPARLRQVLLNVVGNAIKFTERGAVRIVVRCDFEARVLEFEVSDTGIGMDAVTLDRLFQPFTQADGSSTRVHGGSGLGLAIARPLALALGGDITATSAPGRGSQFVVTVATGELSGVERSTSPTIKPLPTPWVAREVCARILLAEDGPDNQRLVSAVLRRAGARVDVVENGKDAADQALTADERGEPYHVVLMDMQMPVLDGYAATSLLRERGYQRPIVALTAHAMRGDRERCLAAGCDDHVPKPIDRQQLVDVILRWTAEPPSERRPAAPGAAPIRSTYADDPDMAEICGEFARELPRVVHTIEEHLAAGDRTAVRRLAHQLKGAGGSYGYQIVTEAAAAMELAANAEDVPLEPHVDELRTLAHRIAAAA